MRALSKILELVQTSNTNAGSAALRTILFEFALTYCFELDHQGSLDQIRKIPGPRNLVKLVMKYSRKFTEHARNML